MSEAADRALLLAKLKALQQRRGESWPQMFAAYSGGDGELKRNELMRLLADADVGNAFSRGAWANGILEHVDVDGSGGVSRPELERVINSGTPTPPTSSPGDHTPPASSPGDHTPPTSSPGAMFLVLLAGYLLLRKQRRDQ